MWFIVVLDITILNNIKYLLSSKSALRFWALFFKRAVRFWALFLKEQQIRHGYYTHSTGVPH
jgi:hypothetical protein